MYYCNKSYKIKTYFLHLFKTARFQVRCIEAILSILETTSTT